jgi:hypothetical protein
MGSAQSRNVIQSTVNVMNKSTNRVALEQVTSVNVVQALNIVGNRAKGDIIVRGNKQTINASVDAASYLNAMQSNETKQAIQQELEQMASSLVSGINFGNSTESSNEIATVLSMTNEVVNSASMKCQTTLNTSQVINVTENVADGDVLVEGQEQQADVKAISKCQLDAVQGNKTIQDAQQKIKQTAIAETKGLDPLAFLGMIIAVIVIIIGGGIAVSFKAGSKVAAKATSIVTALLSLAGIGTCAYLVFFKTKQKRPQWPPPRGTKPEDFFFQYPFLRHTHVHSQCGQSILIDGVDATQVLGVEQVAGRRNQLLVDWVKQYNAAVEKHREGSGKTKEDYAKLPLASATERILPPAADAAKDKRWDAIHAAYIGPGSAINSAGARRDVTDTSVIKIWAYGFAPRNHMRDWSQWTGSDSDAIYKDRPDLYKRTTTNAIMELVNEGKILMDALVAIVAKPSSGDYQNAAPQFTVAGAGRNRAKASDYFKELIAMDKRQCGTWIDPFLPIEPPVRVNNDTNAPVAKFATDVYKFGRDVFVETDETLNLKQCLPEAIMYQYLMGLYTMDTMLQQEVPPGPEVLWQLLTGKTADQTLALADTPGINTTTNRIDFGAAANWPGTTDSLHGVRGVGVQFSSTFSSRAEPLLHLVARARKDVANGFVQAHQILGANLTDPTQPISQQTNWWSAWSTNVLKADGTAANNPFELSSLQRGFLVAWDASYSLWAEKLRLGFESFNNGTPIDEQSWKDVTVVSMKYANSGNTPLVGSTGDNYTVFENSFFSGEPDPNAGFFGDISNVLYIVMGLCGLVFLGSVRKFVRARANKGFDKLGILPKGEPKEEPKKEEPKKEAEGDGSVDAAAAAPEAASA